jgi:hypothetical protein
MVTSSDFRTRAAVLLAFAAAFALFALVVRSALSASASGVDGPPVTRISAFAAPPVGRAVLPQNVRVGLDGLSNRKSHGDVVLADARLLGHKLGINRVSVYAAPTTEGAVCVLFDERTYVATCASEFSSAQGNLISALYWGEGVPFTVAGLAADEVESVTVVLNGEARPASLSNNVFFWQSESANVSRESLDQIRAEQINGSTITVDTP